MHTRCPKCQTVFPIDAPALRVRHGEVRCGHCRELFDAIPALLDQAPETLPEIPVSLTDIPVALREDMARAAARQTTRARRFALNLGIVLLGFTLLGQWIWFHPQAPLQHFPNAEPWISQFCAYSGCRMPNPRDPARIRILDRDVRVHPKYEGALLVTVGLQNTLTYPQPYPAMRLTLFNVNGQVIASRVFEPKIYLDKEINLATGMAPGRPTQVVLDVLAQEEAAVSFEFLFL